MKAAALHHIKQELDSLSHHEIKELCLKLTRFKKDNKELLSYLLFESQNEGDYIQSIKKYMDTTFKTINTDSYFYIRKSTRKILRYVKKYIRYSKNKETEVELLLYFCKKLNDFEPDIKRSTQLLNMYNRQIALSKKIINTLHNDLQYDFNLMLEDF